MQTPFEHLSSTSWSISVKFFAHYHSLPVPSLLSSNNTGVDKMTQLTTETDLVTSSETVFNISANITMPFKILNIFSYTHSLNVKVIQFPETRWLF